MSEVLDRFQDTFNNAGVSVDPTLIPIIESGIVDPHTGIFVADFVKAATRTIERPDGRLSIENTPAALAICGLLMAQTGDRYRATTEVVPSPEGDVWQDHVKNVRAGDIKITLPPESWMIPREARNQVARADYEFSRTNGDEQVALCIINYGFFKPQTMADAAETLAKTPEKVAGATELEAMPWLQITNWTGAQIAQHSYEQMAQKPTGTLHVIDMCPGSGATSATIINRLQTAQANGHDLGSDRLSLLAIETTPGLYDQYVQNFIPAARTQLSELGLKNDDTAVTQSAFDHCLRAGTVRAVEGDVTSTIRGLDLSEIGPDDVVEAHINYGAHRLSSKQKDIILTKFDEVENCVLVVGDLWENCAPVNLGYFNEGYNGSLNAGNTTLVASLNQHGFEVMTVSLDADPDYVDKALLDRLRH